jgi:hypothetical protein
MSYIFVIQSFVFKMISAKHQSGRNVRIYYSVSTFPFHLIADPSTVACEIIVEPRLVDRWPHLSVP